MLIQKTDFPNATPTTSERIQLTVGIAINDALNAVVRLTRRVRSLGR